MTTKPQAPVALVRGGTQTTQDARAQELRHADAERRRAVQDAEFARARKSPAEARVTSLSLGGTKTHPSVVLWLKRPREIEPRDFMLCELSTQPADGGDETVELVLMMACPRCITRLHRPAEESNFHIRQSNRHFEFDPRPPKWLTAKWKGSLWINPDDPTETVMVAGTVTMTEKARCPACQWLFTIDDSIVYTEN